ncbi:MAG TPA: lysophospholipid acyltransferase family protein [Steroidobacteraceae bacterium]|nr:lysophospholipid acyltransferase family protein [Steroidobacteraceae bacterium]
MPAPPSRAGRRPHWVQELGSAVRGLRRRSLFLAMRWLTRRVGFTRIRRIGSWLGAVHYTAGTGVRRRCLAGLAALMRRRASDPAVARTLREAYRVNTIAVLEVLAMVDRRLETHRVREHCQLEGVEQIDAARQGRGAILLATHSGNGLLLAACLADAGWPVSVVYRHTRMLSKQFFSTGLRRYDIEAILANEGFRAYARMLDALRANRVVFVMIDQGVEKSETGLMLQFLGKQMPMPGGVVQLARQARAPILPVVTLAAEPRWHFMIQSPIQLRPGGSLESDSCEVLQHVEAAILARPQLWSWPHRRWRNFPVAPTADDQQGAAARRCSNIEATR